MTDNRAPEYVVRVFTRRLGVIYLNNVLSISTSISTEDGGTGQFSIVADYKQGEILDYRSKTEEQLFANSSYFFAIEPMDYIEIYIRDKDPINSNGNLAMHNNDVAPIGIYNAKGNYTRAFNQKRSDKSIVDAMHEEPLSIQEKINNPDFILCGFIDNISNNFNINNNTLSISGRGIKKFLDEHHPWVNIPDQGLVEIINFKQKYNFQLPPAMAVYTVLDIYLYEYFVGLGINGKEDREKYEEVAKANLTSTTAVFHKALGAKDFQDVKTTKRNKKTTTYNLNIRDIPSTFYVNYGLNQAAANKSSLLKDVSPEWGRMEYEVDDRVAKLAKSIEAGRPLWQMISEFSQYPYYEFFMDETGNLVLRNLMEAWQQIDYTDPSVDLLNDSQFRYMVNRQEIKRFAFEDWIKLDESDLIGWNFNRSDNELRTLVQNVPSASVFGSAANFLGLLGQMPITEQYLKALTNDPTLKKDKVSKTLRLIKKLQSKHFNGFPLYDTKGILRYWTRYGIRPRMFTDLYSQSAIESILIAAALFDHFGTNFWTGTLRVKGKSSYKVGRRVKLTIGSPTLNALSRKFLSGLKSTIFKDYEANNPDDKIVMYFYCTGVSHNFTWGEGWTTTLSIKRGEMPGTLSDQSSVLGYLVDTRETFAETGQVTENPPKKPFSKEDVTLSIKVSPTGGGTITTRTGKYSNGSRVFLIAKPAEGYVFSRWTGDVNGTSNPKQVVLLANASVTAVFKKGKYTLDANI